MCGHKLLLIYFSVVNAYWSELALVSECAKYIRVVQNGWIIGHITEQCGQSGFSLNVR